MAPGLHEVLAVADGSTVRRTATVGAGERQIVVLAADAVQAPVATPLASPLNPAVLAPASVTPPAPARGRFFTWVSLGAAGAAGAGGIGFGLAASSDSQTLLGQSHHQPQVQALYQSAKTRETIANGCYVGAGVAAVATVGLFFFEPSL